MGKYKLYFMLLMLFSFLFIIGCQDNNVPPSSNFVDRSVTDYSFVDVSSNCNIHHNVNISDMNITGYETVCTAGRTEMFMFFSEEYNWSIMCCEFSEDCALDTQRTENYENLCGDKNLGQYTGYVYNDDGFWLAQCCDKNGGSCYVDLEIDTANDSTVCDEAYHQNSYGVKYNGSKWQATCCIGGLEE